jgi:hypothetical protein
MATKTFYVSSDASVAIKPDGSSRGQGAGENIVVGKHDTAASAADRWLFRSIINFDFDWSGVTNISAATITVYTYPESGSGTSGNTNIVWERGDMVVQRNTSSWKEGVKGDDDVWWSTNAVIWSNKPSVTTVDQVTVGSSTFSTTRPATPTAVTFDVIDVIKYLAPTTVNVLGSANTVGDQENYGITLKMSDETDPAIEFCSKEINSGAYQSYITITYDSVSIPSVTSRTPTSGSIATIHNIEDTNVWDSTSARALPTISWVYSGNGGGDQISWWMRIWNSSTSTSTAAIIFDSGEIEGDQVYSGASSVNLPSTKPTWMTGLDQNGNAGPLGSGNVWKSGYYGIKNGDQETYWWEIQVESASGIYSGWTARTPFKVRWTQSQLQFDLGTGYTATSAHVISIDTVTPSASSQYAILYGSVSSSTASASVIYSAIDETAASGRYLQVATRIAANNGASSTPTIPKITLNYQLSSIAPDKWYADGASVQIQPTIKRFGTQSASLVTTSTSPFSIQPYTILAGDDISVSKNTIYTFSAYVYRPDSVSRDVRIIVLPATGSTSYTSTNRFAISDPIIDYPEDSEGWRRVFVNFQTGVASDSSSALGVQSATGEYEKIKILVYGYSGTSGDKIYVDGVQIDEGTVVSAYSPGLISGGMTVEGGGISVDASKGGVFQIRGSTAGSRDIVKLGSNGIVFGGATDTANLYSPTASTLKTDNSLSVGTDISVTGSITHTGASITSSGIYLPSSKTITFEGSTDDAFETTITVTDPTVDRTITIPNVDGTVQITGQTITLGTDITGNVTLANAAMTLNANIAAGAVDTTELAANSVTTAKIASGAVDTAQLAANSVTSAKIAAGAVDTADLADGSVTSIKIATDAVTSTQIAANAVGASELSDSISITTSGTMTPTGTADITGTSGYNSVYMGGSSGTSKRFYRFTGVSETRIKENITPTEVTAGSVYGIKPIDFNFRESARDEYPNIEFPTTRQWGLTVEETRAVFPSAISGGHDGQPYGIHWERIYFGMLVAIKDLNARVELLESKIAEKESTDE